MSSSKEIDFAACVYLSEAQNPIPPPPPHLTNRLRVYSTGYVYTVQYIYSHGGGGVEPERRLEGQQFTKLGRKNQLTNCFDPSRPTFYRKRTVSQRKRENVGNPGLGPNCTGAYLSHLPWIDKQQPGAMLPALSPAHTECRARAGTPGVEQTATFLSLDPDNQTGKECLQGSQTICSL